MKQVLEGYKEIKNALSHKAVSITITKKDKSYIRLNHM
jgi:hypothetical protein